MPKVDLLITDIAQLVTCANGGKPKRGAEMRELAIIPNGAVAITEGKISAIGAEAEILSHYPAKNVLSAQKRAVCAGLVDCHTHVVYGGNRAHEFELRIQGKSYLEIMAAGGGIRSTMHATRAATLEDLIQSARLRLDEMLALGTTTAEIKTGYGLDSPTEEKLFQAIIQLAQTHVMDIVPTFLGAHAIPPEFTPADYVTHLIEVMIPQAASWYKNAYPAGGVPYFIDVFTEENAFDLEQTRRILAAGMAHGMQVKAHLDEFNNLQGVPLCIELGAVSVDHLDVTPEAELEQLAHSNTVGVVLPAVNFNLGSCHFANARHLIDSGGILALATDINPGSAPTPSLPMVMAIACRYQKLLPAEALNACTLNAAYAMGLGDQVGSLEVGKQADLLILKTDDYRCLMAEFGGNNVATVIKKGVVVA